MKSFALFFSLVVAASALTTPHVVRHSGQHKAIAARLADPEPVASPVAVVKRAPRRICRPRQSSSSSVAAPSDTDVPSAPPVNAAPIPTTTSTRQQDRPRPTSSSQAQNSPSPTPQPQPAPTTSQAPAPAPGPTGNLPSFMVGTQTGEGTFYDTGLGACGITNKDTDFIVAVSWKLFDEFPGYNKVNPNSNPICNRGITARYQGKSVKVIVTDRCGGCETTDLDFSPSAFAQLADFGAGRIRGVEWTWD